MIAHVLIVDRQPAFAHGVASLLRDQPDFAEPEICLSVHRAADRLRYGPFDVLALGMRLDGDPVALCRHARTSRPGLRAAIFFEAGDGMLVGSCRQQVASTVLLRDASVQEIVGGLRALAHGVTVSVAPDRIDDCASVLSSQEQRIIELVGRGLTSAEVASMLCLAPNTVRSYCQAILRKLGARNRAHALELARAQGMLDGVA